MNYRRSVLPVAILWSAVATIAWADTFTVSTTDDTGTGSLRQAITDANNHPGLDTINFNIPGTGVHTISLASDLPTVTDAVLIDGYSQPGSSANTSANGDNAVLLVELHGEGPGANVAIGLHLTNGATTVRGLVINNCALTAIVIATNDCMITGNFLGTDATGMIGVPNSSGVQIGSAANTTIGGLTPDARNVISGNPSSGVGTNGSTNTVIQGNFIGTTATGTAALGNDNGIFLSNSAGDVIGGTVAGAGNVISGNTFGVDVEALGTIIQGNRIGTTADGGSPLGNVSQGITVNVSGVQIGGTVAGSGNIIAFNGLSGVELLSGTGNAILGNTIFGNSAGNPVFGTGLGIDLNGSGAVIANDPCDADTGNNNLQNFPVLTAATSTAGNVNITGTLNSTANTTFRLEFFANDAIDPSGYGEGQRFVGFTNVTTDATCNAAFDVNFPVSGAAHITATATDPNGNTSEFSAAIGQLLNISSRLHVQTGENVLIAGFIIGGSDPKKVMLRGIGPSLSAFGVPGVLADPTLELHDASTTLETNDNWKTRADGSSQQAVIEATGIAPTNDLESAIVRTLPANNAGYTAIVRGKNNTTGVGVVEAYDLDTAANSKLGNISTRGLVETGDNILIGGFIAGNGLTKVLIRAIGPSLANFGITNPLLDPTLELHDNSGTTIATNDDWQTTQESEIIATGIPPTDPRESAIVSTLPPGAYTAVVRGKNNATGIAVVEIYNLQ